MTRKPLSAVDTAWLRMEDPTNMMMITGVMIFSAPMDFERLKATMARGLLPFDRFGKRVVESTLGNFYWEDDPDFDLNYHLQRATLPPPGDQTALQDLASLLSSTQLDFSRPLWQLHLVEGYGDGCALICRLHHSIGDGLALVYVLLSLTDTVPDTPWPVVQPEREQPRSFQMKSLLGATRATCKTTKATAKKLVRDGWGTLTHPSRFVDAAKLGARGGKALARLLLLWPDPKTVFKGPLQVSKRTAWSAAIPFRDIKTVRKKLDGTVNDVLLTAMSGGLRRYLEKRGEAVEGLNFRAVVPVNLRKPGTEHELGNKFGLFFLSLPIGIADPQECLAELKRRMDALKDSLEAPVAFGILTAIGEAPEAIQDLVVNIFGLKGTAVMTNVKGPPMPLYLAGSPLESLMFWVPQSGRLGMGVSILSYNDQVWMGVITDEGLVPDPEVIIDGFHAEFDRLLEIAQKPEEAPSLKDVATKLDETLEVLDEVLEKGAPAEPEAEAKEMPARCQALTKAGKPCRNRPLSGSSFCRVHQKT